MNKTLKRIAIIVLGGLTFFITSCEQKQAQLPDWLEGQWVTGDSIGFTTESWEKINSQFMTGEGLFILPDNQTVVEVLNIFTRDGLLFYTAMLPNQNNGEEIMFIDSQNNPDSLVFENPLHNYPKKIIYYKKSNDIIEVSIFGEEKEGANKIILKRHKHETN
jgi:hypothetical protein